MSIEALVLTLSKDMTDVIPVNEIRKHDVLYWGGNGVGDRFAGKKFNYTSVKGNGKTTRNSQCETDEIPKDALSRFRATSLGKKGNTIIGIFIHSLRTEVILRPIRADIRKALSKCPCAHCGSSAGIVIDHKNDMHNDPRVLCANTQLLVDFQPLCTHCNLQKRQVAVRERETERLYSAKKIPMYASIPYEIPWEKYAFDKKNPQCKKESFWYDPSEFERKKYLYCTIVLPVVAELRRKFPPSG
jgi:hypothetical protein